MSICCASQSSTSQPCDKSLNNFNRLGLGAVLRASVRRHRRAQRGPSTLRSITPTRATRFADASVDPTDARYAPTRRPSMTWGAARFAHTISDEPEGHRHPLATFYGRYYSRAFHGELLSEP